MYTMMSLYLISSIIYIFVGLMTYYKNKKSRLNQLFLLLCLNLFFRSFFLALISAVENPGIATYFRIVNVFSSASLYSILLVFVIILTGNEKYFKNKYYYGFLFIPSVITIYLYVFDPVSSSDLIKTNVGWVFLNPTDKGFLWNVFLNAYYMGYMTIVIIMLFLWHKKTRLKRQKKQAKIILIAMIFTFTLASFTDVVLPLLGVKFLPPLTIFIALTIIIAIAYSMIKYGLMVITNEKIVSDVFKIMNEGLIILNQDYYINAINQGALKMLGYKESDILNKSVELLFEDINLEDCFKVKSSHELNIIKSSGDLLPILASSSILFDNFGDRLGNILIFQDLSSYKEIQSQLEAAYDNLEHKVRERTAQLTNVNSKLEMEIGMRIAKEEKIRDLAYNDQLTRLPNRKSFSKTLGKTIKQSKEESSVFAILFLDLDGFKMINETLGHDQGDLLLKKVSDRLREIIREDDCLARVGGDEFIILIKSVHSIDSIKNTCDDISNMFDKPFELPVADIYTSTSIGIAIYPNDGKDSKTLIKNADIAMYKSKDAGKGKYKFYNSKMLKNLDLTLILTNDLHKAIENNELEVYYQPQNDITSHRIRGLEALVRWNHPKYGIIRPDLFIPIAEHTGLINDVGRWVLDQSCKDFKRLREVSEQITSIGVNISVNQIINHSLVDQVEEILKANEVSAKHLELEITESFLLNDEERVLKILYDLKSTRVRIAVDDFGTEYSSLRYLKRLPLDRIKIDKTFIDGIGVSEIDEAIIAAIVFLGKQLKLSLIAEGVESADQLEFLKRIGCNEIQGYYFYKPMRFDEVKEALLNEIKYKKDILIN